jgi:hypothetical protein
VGTAAPAPATEQTAPVRAPANLWGEEPPTASELPVWQKKVNLRLVDKLEVQLSLKELATRIELLTAGK